MRIKAAIAMYEVAKRLMMYGLGSVKLTGFRYDREINGTRIDIKTSGAFDVVTKNGSELTMYRSSGAFCKKHQLYISPAQIMFCPKDSEGFFSFGTVVKSRFKELYIPIDCSEETFFQYSTVQDLIITYEEFVRLLSVEHHTRKRETYSMLLNQDISISEYSEVIEYCAKYLEYLDSIGIVEIKE